MREGVRIFCRNICSSVQSLWFSIDQTCTVQRYLYFDSLTQANWGFFAIFVEFFLLYNLEGVLVVLKLQNRLQRHRISLHKYPGPFSSIPYCSGVASLAKYFEKHRFRTIFTVFEPFCKSTSGPFISGHWPYIPRSSAPGLQRLLISGTGRLLVE